MSSMSEDIQCAGSDTRPPMLDRTDFESWQQRIRLYCLGKDNGENIMKSINEGPFHMGTVSDVIAGGTEGAVQQGPVRARVLNDLSAEEKERYKADIRATNILLQGIPKDIYSLINHYTDAKDIWENVKMILEGSELTKDDRESQLYDEFEHFRQNKGETIQGYYVRFTKLINDMRNIKMTMPRMQLNSKFVNNMLPEWSRFITEVKLNRGLKESNFDQLYAYLKQHEVHANENRTMMEKECPRPKRLQDSDYFKDKMLLMQAQENGAVLDEEQSLFLAGEQIINFDGGSDECDAFDSDVDEGPTTQTMFMTNLTSEDRIYDEAGPSYDSNTPYEVQDHDTFVNHLDEYHEVHKMQTDEQHNYVVDSDADYTSNSNIIPYDQYVEDNEDHVVQRNVSSVRNDALMSILDEMHEQGVQSRLANKPDIIINDSVTSELARYKELVGEYEKRAKFELTDREQKFDEQMRIISQTENRKGNFLKSELHSAQIQLSSIPFKKKDNVIRDLKVLVANVNDRSCEPYNAKDVTALIEQNDGLDRTRKGQTTLQECMGLIKITPHSHEVQDIYLLNEIESLKAQFEKQKSCSLVILSNQKFLRGMYSNDVKPIPIPLRTSRRCLIKLYQGHFKESVIEKGVNDSTEASGSKPRSNTKKNRILPAKKENKKKVEVHLRTNKSVWTKVNRIDSSISLYRL
ncbi:hypothetical protein Tco_1501749 [Tanacetum coccineum]